MRPSHGFFGNRGIRSVKTDEQTYMSCSVRKSTPYIKISACVCSFCSLIRQPPTPTYANCLLWKCFYREIIKITIHFDEKKITTKNMLIYGYRYKQLISSWGSVPPTQDTLTELQVNSYRKLVAVRLACNLPGSSYPSAMAKREHYCQI